MAGARGPLTRAPVVKRSRAVPLTLVASATSLAACAGSGATEPLRCVDQATRQVVADSLCRTAANAGAAGDTVQRRAGGAGISPFFLWYFGGRVANGLVSGGSYRPIDGRRYQSPTGIGYSSGRGWRTGGGAVGAGNGIGSARPGGSVRGGFGRTGAGRGGFGG